MSHEFDNTFRTKIIALETYDGDELMLTNEVIRSLDLRINDTVSLYRYPVIDDTILKIRYKRSDNDTNFIPIDAAKIFGADTHDVYLIYKSINYSKCIPSSKEYLEALQKWLSSKCDIKPE